MVLYEHAIERKIQEAKFNALLHGADPKELDKKEEFLERKENLLFGDPEEYKNMSDEERKKLTNKMRSKFIKWAKGS